MAEEDSGSVVQAYLHLIDQEYPRRDATSASIHLVVAQDSTEAVRWDEFMAIGGPFCCAFQFIGPGIG